MGAVKMRHPAPLHPQRYSGGPFPSHKIDNGEGGIHTSGLTAPPRVQTDRRSRVGRESHGGGMEGGGTLPPLNLGKGFVSTWELGDWVAAQRPPPHLRGGLEDKPEDGVGPSPWLMPWGHAVVPAQESCFDQNDPAPSWRIPLGGKDLRPSPTMTQPYPLPSPREGPPPPRAPRSSRSNTSTAGSIVHTAAKLPCGRGRGASWGSGPHPKKNRPPPSFSTLGGGGGNSTATHTHDVQGWDGMGWASWDSGTRASSSLEL